MENNPVLLVNQVLCSCIDAGVDSHLSLDAIFVPFRSRSSYVRQLLTELEWFDGPIYLMPSDEGDMAPFIAPEIDITTITLQVEDPEFRSLHKGLLTSQHRLTSATKDQWDLPEKRNYALLFARQKGYKAILIIDDDIRNVDFSCAYKGVSLLNSYKVCGCLVTDFPDTSVQGHLERVAGQPIFPFLSGSFLFIHPMHVQSFFPSIYNEDWLFMLPYICERSICSFGAIKQMPYDPFADIHRAIFQEFGEVIAEGLFSLLRRHRYDERFSSSTWDDIITARSVSLRELSLVVDKNMYGIIIEAMLQANANVTPDDCVNFVSAWEADTEVWNKYIERSTK